MSAQKELGVAGETLAAQEYRRRGYIIVARNYRTRHGEIDLLAQKDDLLVVVEVKTRTNHSLAAPCEAVTPAKQRRLIAAAGEYLAAQGKLPIVRFDVAEVLVFSNSVAEIHCIENAFTV